ncbi:GLPGLI family protein [Chishuiella changwenlii]|uniref:GLPGLI family protein n=1 Tax=Chishuiella changwenlii TaxID=1434701 RepID=A0A1M7C4S1_9FLAO|nr:GLPGLI family protein [Chishuiella changwenlii]GGF05609.1 hypothetical protein GCM10010984_23590 [Chishuiella changwenlii]SHL62210.1 GLPGLI family protein [Chishuiella changwenlii]
MIKYLIVLLPIFSFSQEAIRVEYEMKQEFDKQAKDKLGIKYAEILQNSENKRYYYELLANTKQSQFLEIERINNDQNSKGATLGLSTNVSANIYKDFNMNVLYEENTMKSKLLVKDSLQHFTWVLTKDEASVLGYKVKKATYSNNNQMVEAWYTTELPFRDGPSRFSGLPGLILKVNFKLPFVADMDTNVSFTAIDVKPYSGKIEISNKFKIVSREEFKKEVEKNSSKFNTISSGVEKD